MTLSLSMTIEEIKKKIKNEVPLQTIADLNGLDLKTFEKIIRQYEQEHGEQILPKRKPGRPKTSTPARSTKYTRAKAEREKKEDSSDFGKLAVIAKMQHEIENLEEYIEKTESDLKYAQLELKAWKQLKEEYDK